MLKTTSECTLYQIYMLDASLKEERKGPINGPKNNNNKKGSAIYGDISECQLF